jgi:TRAP-type C4-dicarboxylate transport system substrate-binding protein
MPQFWISEMSGFLGQGHQGKLEMTAADTSSLVRFTSGFGVINFPFLLGDEQDADALLDSKFGQDLLDLKVRVMPNLICSVQCAAGG